MLIIVVVVAVLLAATVAVGRVVWHVASGSLPLPSALVRSQLRSVALPTVASPLEAGVVDVNTQLAYQNAAGAGTGILLSPSGEVLTNNHVIIGASSVSVTDVGTGRTYPATVVGYDRSHDIAVLQVQGASGLPTASIGDSDTVSIGDWIAAVGNAGGVGGPPTVAPGRVSALDRTITASDAYDGTAEQLTGLIQIAAHVVPGDSGGPLVNTAGQVVGIDTAASMGFHFLSPRGEGFAIPINDAMAITKQIEAGTGSQTVHIGPTGVLGVMVQDTSAPTEPSLWGIIHRRYNLGVPAGLTIVGVVQGLPGDQAGLAAGDTILAVDNTAIDSATTLTTVLNWHHPGDSVRLTWLDPSGQQHDATVALAPGPPN